MPHATYPEASGGQPFRISYSESDSPTSEKRIPLLYLVLLRVGFTVPQGVSTLCGGLLHHLFTLTGYPRRWLT